MSVDRCVCCGEIIPEGRQVCILCERKANAACQKRWRDANREHVREYRRKYYWEHRDHILFLQKRARTKKHED